MKFSVIVLACVLAIAPALGAPASSLQENASPSALPEVSAPFETSAAPEASATPEISAAVETSAVPESSAVFETPVVFVAPEAPVIAAAPEASVAAAAPVAPVAAAAPVVLKVSVVPEAPAALEASAAPQAPKALEASVAPKVEEKPAPVVSSSVSPPIYRSYVAPEAFFPIAPVASVAPVAPVAPSSVFVNIPKYVSNARDAETLRYSNDISPNGAFNYFFETNNGIAAQAEGIPRSFYSGADEVSPVVEQGSFAWISPEGQEIFISYVADENGYQPTGNAIPQAPEIPPAILRSLEFIARSRSSLASTK